MQPLEPIVPIPHRFSHRTVLVTGAASGIGAATAHRFSAEGAHVLVTDIDAQGAERVAIEIREGGGQAEAEYLDQADESSISAFVASRSEGGLDAACINAGAVLDLGNIETTSPAGWDRILGVNLRGAFLLSRALIPLLRLGRWPSIVYTASIASLRGHGGSGAYASSKAGLLGLSRSLALEVGADGIRVNCVCPGPVASLMGGTVTDLQPLLPTIALGRVAEPTDIAAVICFLASADARHITAAEIVVDGGATAEIPLPESARAGARTARRRAEMTVD